jgi:hypothetical protein
MDAPRYNLRMRLLGYAALELGLAGMLILGVGFVGAQGLSRLARFAKRPPAVSSVDRSAAAKALRRRQDLPYEVAGPAPAEAPGTFLGMSDDLLLARLRDQPVARLKLNRGGSSLSFRMDLADGSRAAWKPAQTNTQTVPRKEVAAYRLNRLLGLNVVPPAVPRAIAKDELFGLLHPESLVAVPRIRAEAIVGPNGSVSGAASYWIPVIRDSEFDSPSGQQQVALWLTQGEPIPFAQRAMAAQLSTLAVFDFLTANPDRHSGGNMKTSADGGVLFFMDNTMSFFIEPESTDKNRAILLRTQKFSRRLSEALPRVELRELGRRMREQDGSESLTEAEIRTLVMRREYVQRYLATLIAQFGEQPVLCFP